MNIENLISKGYFPKELPPPFTTEKLYEVYKEKKSTLNGYVSHKKATQPINFSLAKVGLIRKTVNIPNPIHQVCLSELIVDRWSEINEIINKSKFSCTKNRKDGKRAYNIMQFKEFRRKCFLGSYQYSYELKTDISKYFSSIYTHSIPWAIHTKEIAKQPANRDNVELLGVDLDKRLRSTMFGQTNGIPISPDTSLIISELIASEIDDQLLKWKPDLKGYRYVDDMHFFFDTQGEAESCLSKLQEILQSYQLVINEEKTEINSLPKGMDKSWVSEIRSFNFRETPIKQYNDIIDFFSLAFRLSKENKNEYVLSFAVRTVMYLKVLSKNNYLLLETMLLKVLLAETATIADVFKIIFSNKEHSNINRIKRVVIKIIEKSAIKSHDYELAWSLWFAKTFEIKLDKITTDKILISKDQISFLIVLDLANSGLINKSELNLEFWENKLNQNSLTDEYWLIAYEMTIKKWLGNEYSYLTKVPYFKCLNKNSVEFYNPNLQVSTMGSSFISVGDNKDIDPQPYLNEEKDDKETSKIKSDETEKVINPNTDLPDLADMIYYSIY